MYPDKKVKIIFNPNAHRGASVELFKQLKAELDRQDISYVVLETKKHKDAIELSEKNIEDNDIVFIVGGDGTVYETINGTITKNNIRYFIIPAGTGNDLYGTMKNKFSFEDAMQSLKKNLTKKCNTITINETVTMSLFLAYGIVIDIIMECRKGKKKNHFCYMKAAAKSMFSHKPTYFKYLIEDGKMISVKADYIGLHNAPRAGGGMRISPFSSIDDNKFELVILEYDGFVRRVLNFVAIVRKKIDTQPNYRSISCKKVQVKSIQDEIFCVDGEILKGKEIVAKLNNGFIEFYV